MILKVKKTLSLTMGFLCSEDQTIPWFEKCKLAQRKLRPLHNHVIFSPFMKVNFKQV